MCLICVDGIDESANCDFWKEKIAEAKTYEKDFSRIKFVFLSRPYVFPRYYELDYRDCFSRIPSSGDVAVTDIFDDYVNYYNIDIGVNIWIRNALRTPIALRLFCDLYQNQKIDILPQNSLVLTSLFKKKMESLEITFGRIEGVANRHEMVKTLLITIADLLISQDKVCYEVIEKECTSIIRNHLEPLLDFVEKEGFVFSFINGEDPFSILETFYSWGIQPAFDYLIARKLYDSVKQGKEISSNYSQGILQMLSLIALEEDGKLLFQYENVKFNENEHFELVCFALANASIETVEKFADYVKKLMNVSAAQFRKIVDRIVIPVCRVENHPLGSVLLDDFLRSKKEPAKRDIWWSIPANLRNSYDAEWGCYTEINISDLILKGGSYMGAPLLLVWRLSSVDNDVRHECRAKLTEWGIENQSEFYQLVVYCADINDEQIIEDLFAIAYGISLSQNVEEDYLTSTSEWIINHVFSPSGLKCYENVAVRYYCGGIVKIALLKGVCDEKCLEKITPPYKCKENIMPIYKEALNSERLSGYGPIGYDLARYVLCDRLDRFFRENHKTNEYFEDTKQFLLEYKEKYGVEVKKPGGLIISIAYQYLLANGWEEKAFGGYKEKENIGVDTSIKRTYYSATHGKMSKVMTVAEKYVWIARHRMEAMFADRMRWYDYENGRVVVQDYLDLESFTNTYQDYIDLKQCKYNEQWFHKEQLAVTADEEFSLDNIQKWMHNDELLKFATWIKDNEGKYIIYACSNINNKKAGIEETLWISSGAVKRGEFKKFLRLLNVYSEDRSILQNVSEFHSYQKSSCYCTPQEVCTIQGDREIEDKILLGESGSTVEVYKLIESCLSENAEKGERSFYFPNRLVRKLTGITYGDGYQYLNSKGEIIGIYTDAGENFEDCQGCLLIDADVLTKAMCQGEYQMFWLFRDYRSPSGKVMEAHGYSIEHDTDRSFVVWFEGEECKFVELKDIEPLR